MQLENRFIASIHNHLPKKRILHREKNHNQYRSGTADVWYSGSLDDLWVEYKYRKPFPTRIRFLVPELTALQLDWINTQHNFGRNVCVIQGFPEGGVVYTAPDLECGLDIDELKSRMMTRKELAAWITQRCVLPEKYT